MAKLSLVCEEGSEVCYAHVALSQPFMKHPNTKTERERTRDLKKTESICGRKVEKRERAGWRRVDGFDYTQIWPLSSPQRGRVKQKQMETISQSVSNKLQQAAG